MSQINRSKQNKPGILKETNSTPSFSKLLSQVQSDLQSYIKFYKKRREVNNLLVKISILFYNELILIPESKNSSDIISQHLENYGLVNSLKIINQFSNDIVKTKVNKNYEEIIQIIEQNPNTEAFSFIKLSDLIIDISTKIYLSGILSKKNQLSIKKLDISNNLQNILKELLPGKTKTGTSKGNKYYSSTNEDIKYIISYIDNIYKFKNKINNNNKNLLAVFKDIVNFKKKPSTSTLEYKTTLSQNINKMIDDFHRYAKDLNQILNITTNKINSNSLTAVLKSDTDKIFFYKFVIAYLNIINTFYKLLAYSYEWKYFAQ